MARTQHSDFNCAPGCPVEAALQHIGGKWKGVVIFHLLEKETLRFSELRRAVPNVTQRVLTKQLRELELSGLVGRKIYPEIPPKVEYSITDRGKRLSAVITGLHEFGREYFDNDAASKSDGASKAKRGSISVSSRRTLVTS